MKIAIYYPWLHLKSGVERTILETVKRSKHEYTILTNHYDRGNTYPEFKDFNVIQLKNIPVKRNILSAFKAALIISLQKVDLSGFDALIIHSEGLGDLFLLRNSKIPTICFCYTPLRPVFDPEYKKRALDQRNLVRQVIYLFFDILFREIDQLLWKKYKFIIFDSIEAYKRAKAGNLLYKFLKYKILHPGVDWEKIKPSWVFDKYYLASGRIMWTKNIELAIESFKLFNKTNNTFKLIIAGHVDQKSRIYFQNLKNITAGLTNIRFIINPTDKKMHQLYSRSYAGLFMSFNEDWGITPIEANAFGKPVIAVNKGGFKESQVNGVTGYLVNSNPKEIANQMLKMSAKPGLVLKLGENARKLSEKYSWTNFIEEFDKLINNNFI